MDWNVADLDLEWSYLFLLDPFKLLCGDGGDGDARDWNKGWWNS